MPEDTFNSNFEKLEKQMAKDALDKALKNLHEEVIREIDRNKKAFSEEIKKTLTSFKKDLEKNVTAEIDHRISALFAQHFSDTSSQVRANFHDMFHPVLERTKEDMQRLHSQGEDTLQAWKSMMWRFSSFWNKPFFLIFSVAILTGVVISFLSSYFLIGEEKQLKQSCTKNLELMQVLLQRCESQFPPLSETSQSTNINKLKQKKKSK